MKKKFKSLELVAKNTINNFCNGPHLSKLKDATSEIDTVRQYQAGDRKLDSKSSLRANLTMSRVFNPEKELTLYLILDTSASQQSKLEMSINICLFLSYIADVVFDKVCLISSSLEEVISPTNDIRQIVSSLEKLYYNNFKDKSDLNLAVNYLRRLEPNNALIFFISDFTFNLDKKCLNNISSINSNNTNRSVALALKNNLELQFDRKLSSIFLDAESGKVVEWDGKRLIDYLNEWLINIKIEFNKTKSDYLLLDFGGEYLNKLGKYLIRT